MDDLRWRLEDIYPDRQHWEQDFTGAKKQLTGIGSYRGRLGDGGTVLLQALQARARLRETCTRIYNYASMLFDGDTTNPAAQELRDRVGIAEHRGFNGNLLHGPGNPRPA